MTLMGSQAWANMDTPSLGMFDGWVTLEQVSEVMTYVLAYFSSFPDRMLGYVYWCSKTLVATLCRLLRFEQDVSSVACVERPSLSYSLCLSAYLSSFSSESY